MKNMYPQWKTEVGGEPTFWGVFLTYYAECAKGWKADSTIEKYDGILLNHILPNLKNHNHRAIGSYTSEELLEVIPHIKKLGKNRGNGPFEPFDQKTLDGYAFALRRVMEVAAKHYLWDGTLDTDDPKKKGHRSTQTKVRVKKTLTREQERTLVSYIAVDPMQSGQKMGLYLMYVLGVRNAEACGYSFRNIKQMQTHPECYKIRVLETTAIDSNETQASGKTRNAPRYSPLIDSVRGFLLKRREYVQSQLIATGYTDVNVDELPIACVGKDFFKRCSADDLTDAAREIFRQLGFKRETLCAINRQRMIENADLRETMENGASDIIEPDLTAYILRRTYATHLAAIGMEQSKIEYLIGHMIRDPYDSRNDLSHEDYLYEMKKQLEKRPLVGSNCLNTDVIDLIPGECVTSTQSHTQTFTIPPNISCVQLSVTAKEPGDALQVTVSPTAEDVPIYKECGLYTKTTDKYLRTIDIDKINQHLYE
jgi:site-specific recombinase XerD